MTEKVSVIVPVFNVEKYLRQCLDSILQQTYQNLEIIIINDGSTDGSDAICREYAGKDSRISYFAKENTGISDTRNVGIRQATGEYVTFVDSDDWVEHTYVEELHDKLKAYDIIQLMVLTLLLPIIISLMRPIVFFIFILLMRIIMNKCILLLS